MKLENQKLTAAPLSFVWSVTEVVVRWPHWTPTVQKVKRLDEGPFGVGSTALIKQPGLPEAKWRVTALTPGEGFTWETRIRGIHFVATHELRTSGAGTSSVLRIELFGVVATLLWPFICSSARRSLETEHVSLKAKCEAMAART